AMRNFKDESFIAQYLSPRVMREFRFFAVLDDDREDKLKVSAIHDDPGFQRVRQILSEQYNLGNREPNIQVWNVDLRGDRSLTLRHQQHQRRPLGDTTEEVMKHIARLWGFTVRLEAVDEAGECRLIHETRAERRAPGTDGRTRSGPFLNGTLRPANGTGR
ncbi:SpoVR family protein, partial [Thauera sinica]